MPMCCLPGCKSRGFKEEGPFKLQYFLYPKAEADPELRQKWDAATGIKKVPREGRVCNLHFNNCDFIEIFRSGKPVIKLKHEAVPSIFFKPEETLEGDPMTKIYTCETCPNRFETPVEQKRHYTCVLCMRPFLFHKHRLKVHYDTFHNTNRIFHCDSCTLTFTTKAYLTRHRTRVHSDQEQSQCTICHKFFSSRVSCKLHMEYTHGEFFEVKCFICENMFKNRLVLSKHIRRAHPDFKQVCKFCMKTFLTYGAMRRHVDDVHGKCECRKLLVYATRKKRYDCQVCSASLDSLYNGLEHVLKLHRQCERCTKELNYMSVKTRCRKCGRVFARKPNLQKHLRTVHGGDQQIECRECGKTFKNDLYLNLHITKMHKKKKKKKKKSKDKTKHKHKNKQIPIVTSVEPETAEDPSLLEPETVLFVEEQDPLL